MKKDLSLLPATFIKRYKRFFTDIRTAQGELLTVHCPNTGSMKNCQVENAPCWYSLSDNPKRKLPGTLEIVTTSFGNLAGVNTRGLGKRLPCAAMASGGASLFHGRIKKGPANRQGLSLFQEPQFTAGSRLRCLQRRSSCQPLCRHPL